MDFLPILFLAILVLASCLVGYWADGLGRKLGKKRLSVFGLRPRHTATMGTVLLGFSVSMFTILAISFLSKDVRTWILVGRHAIDEAKQEKAELQVDREKANEYEQQIRSLENQIHDRGNQLIARSSQIEVQKVRLGDLEQRQVTLQDKLSTTAQQIENKDKQIRLTQKSLDIDVSKLRENKMRLSTLEKRNVEARNESLKEQLRLDNQNQNLSRQIGTQKASLADLESEKTALMSEKSTLGDQLTSSRAALTDLSDRQAHETQVLSQLRQEELALMHEVAEARSYFDSVVSPSRTRPIIYASGQEVTRLSVPDHLSRDEARVSLESLLDQARSVSEVKGAKGHDKYPVAFILDRSTDSGPSADQIKQQAIDDITNKSEPMVLIATSILNQFQGEPVALDVKASENPTVFHKGEVVAESRIDGARPESEILRQISGFLGQMVRNRAREKRMISHGGDESSFGSVNDDELFRAVKNIKSAGHSVWLQAVALDDTHAADQLSLDLHVK